MCVIDILVDLVSVIEVLDEREIAGEVVCLDDTEPLREVDTEPE